MTYTKIDKRKKYIAVIDTETAGNIAYPQVYDLGIVITDKQGTVYETRSIAIKEIFGDLELMSSAYYSNKYQMYIERLANQEMQLMTFENALSELITLIKKYNVKQLSAYNLNFDKRALASTYEKLYNKELSFGDLELVCLQELTASALLTQKAYKAFAEKYNLKTEKGFISQKAEHAYQYLTNNAEFIEEHTGLADALIETELMAKAYRQKKKIQKGATHHTFLGKWHSK